MYTYVLSQSFKRTHEKYQDKFSEDELSAVNYAQAGNSNCKSQSFPFHVPLNL